MPGPYVAILIDPPWPENGGGKIKRGADKHYSTISTKEDIRDAILDSGMFNPASSAHLYLWVTNNYLEWGLWLIRELGFRYITNFPWIKTGASGIGQYARGKHELLLFAVRDGMNARTLDRSIATDFLVGEPRPVDLHGRPIHSAKPPKQYELIRRRTIVGPRLEMFARLQASSNYDTWGNQAPAEPQGDE